MSEGGPRPRPGGSQRGPQPDPVRRPAPGVTELREGHRTGFGSPEGSVPARAGTMYRDIDPAGSGSIWKKTTPSGDTGWVELGAGGGFTPISASIFDGCDTNTDPLGEQFVMKFKVSDSGRVGDFGQVGVEADSLIPPTFTNRWLRYVWYDDGFSAANGNFTVPEDGIYQVHGRTFFELINGVVDNCNLQIRCLGGTDVDISFTEGARNVVPGAADVLLEASGQAFLEAGTVVKMGFGVNLSGLTGLSDTDDVVWVTRADWGVPPPTTTHEPGQWSRFSITKLSDTTP